MEHLDLSKIKKMFFIGIGGIGISALAKLAHARGIEVAGLNDEESEKTLQPLKDIGVHILNYNPEGQDAFELPEADMYVYSDAWIFRGPNLIEGARKTEKPVLSYFEALGQFAKEKKVIAVSGTHGKTTTTAMIADILINAGLDPTVIVGSFAKNIGSNFRKGEGEYLVVEADEYNRHFLNFRPFIGVITNIEADHLDYYKDLDDVKNAFDQFLKQCDQKITDYKEYLDKVPKLQLSGTHNKENAAAAYAIGKTLGLSDEVIQKSLENFSGTWRRLEKLGVSAGGTIIYDDYAHHPTEIRASLQALREIYPGGEKKITLVFQPHLYSRTKALFAEFANSFGLADRVIILPIYFAREPEDKTVSSEKLAEAVRANGVEAHSFLEFTSAEQYVKSLNLGKTDVFVTMGAGEAYKVGQNVFPEALK